MGNGDTSTVTTVASIKSEGDNPGVFTNFTVINENGTGYLHSRIIYTVLCIYTVVCKVHSHTWVSLPVKVKRLTLEEPTSASWIAKVCAQLLLVSDDTE